MWLSPAELKFVRDGCACGVRQDGRAPSHARDVRAWVGVLPAAHGSCRVTSSFSSTEVLAAVKLDAVAEPAFAATAQSQPSSAQAQAQPSATSSGAVATTTASTATTKDRTKDAARLRQPIARVDCTALALSTGDVVGQAEAIKRAGEFIRTD